MTELRTVRATGPADLLALVPTFLGFHPADSVVLVTLGSAPSPVHARVDLPVDPRDAAGLAAHLAGVVDRNGVGAVALLLYTDDAALAATAVDALVPRLAEVRCAVRCAARADGERWWLLGRPEQGPGTPYDLGTHPLTAEAVVEGRVMLASRAELAGTLVGDPAEVEEVETWLDEAADRLVTLLPSREHLVLEGRWVRHRVRRHLADGRRLAASDVARLLLLLHATVELRDVAWAEMHHGNAREHVTLWLDIVRRSPDELRAAPASLLGFAAWLSGRGALAWCAVERAQEAQPGYGLAGLLSTALAGGVPPSAWEPLGPEHLTLFAG
jgi:hypothetical protein